MLHVMDTAHAFDILTAVRALLADEARWLPARRDVAAVKADGVEANPHHPIAARFTLQGAVDRAEGIHATDAGVRAVRYLCEACGGLRGLPRVDWPGTLAWAAAPDRTAAASRC